MYPGAFGSTATSMPPPVIAAVIAAAPWSPGGPRRGRRPAAAMPVW